MPIPREDRHSGAIIFYPTAQERADHERNKRMKAKEQELDQTLAEARELLASLKKKGGEE